MIQNAVCGSSSWVMAFAIGLGVALTPNPASAASPTTCIWVGDGADNLASTPENWSGGVAPSAGDEILLDGAGSAGSKDLIWDLDIKVGSWTQQSSYGGTVTIATVYDENGFDCFEVAGDVSLLGGVWKHLPNSGTNATYRLKVAVGGDFRIDAGAKIDVSGLGYTTLYEEGEIKISGFSVGGSYGGFGGTPRTGDGAASEPYGRYYAPELPGSAGSSTGHAGGGAVVVVCAGKLTLGGDVVADGTYNSGYKYYTGSGGSIWLTCGTIEGEGSLSACSASGVSGYTGSGGRIAVKLTEATDFSGFDLVARANAHSKHTGSGWGAPGSIYGETAADKEREGWLIFKSNGNGSDDVYKSATPFTRDVKVVHVSRLTLGGNLYVQTREGDKLDLANTVVDFVGGSYQYRGLCANGGQIVFDDYSVIDGYKLLVRKNVALRRVEFANNGGILLKQGAVLSVSGAWVGGNSAFSAEAGSVVEFVGEGESRISGTTTFAGLRCHVAGKQFTMATGTSLKATESIDVSGSFDEHIGFQGVDGAKWSLNPATANIRMSFTDVADCNAVSELTIVGGEGENNQNVSYVPVSRGEKLTWIGAIDSAWDNNGNWTSEQGVNRWPVSSDCVVISAIAKQMPLLPCPFSCAGLEVQNGATLNLGANVISVSGAAKIEGTTAAAGGGYVFNGDVTWTGVSPALDFAVALQGDSQTISGSIVSSSFVIGNGSKAMDVVFTPGSSIKATDFLVCGDATLKNVTLHTADGADCWYVTTVNGRATGAVISNSDATGGETVVTTACRDGGGNSGWRFEDLRTHYSGGEWPALDATSELVIDEGVSGTLPVDVAALKSLYVSAGAVLTNDHSVAISGSVTLDKSSMVVWNAPSTIGSNLKLEPEAILTHDCNTTFESNVLDLLIGGDVIVAEKSSINAVNKGYGARTALANHQTVNAGASHGGRGYQASPSANEAWPSYGSIFSPTNCGGFGEWAGVKSPGGGVIHIKACGAFLLNGTVDASADVTTSYYSGSGGSVWIEADTLSGSGKIRANGAGCTSMFAGAGGRISIVLGSQEELHPFTGAVEAYAGLKFGGSFSSAGTVYYSLGGINSISVCNVASRYAYAEAAISDAVDIPSSVANADDVASFENVVIDIKQNGTVNLMQDLTVAGLIYDNTAHLKLNGHVLKVRAKRPKDWPKEGLPSWVVAGGTEDAPGRVDWYVPGLVIFVK